VLNVDNIVLFTFLLVLVLILVVFQIIVNIVVFTALTALLMGREYFSLAALRFGDWARARELRRRHGGAIFVAALAPALLLLVPVANFLTPLFGAAIMVRLHKALTRPS
jgi:CysZ protein